MWPRLVPDSNNRPRGNTDSYVVDTGVSLSTHINSNPSGQLISCQGRKCEGGPGPDDDVTAGKRKTCLLKGKYRHMSMLVLPDPKYVTHREECFL